MKKFLSTRLVLTVLLFIVLLVATMLSGCNKQIIDLNYEFDYAIISLPNGDVVEGEISSWKDYEGEQIQVKMDGKVYLVHSNNITLIKQ